MSADEKITELGLILPPPPPPGGVYKPIVRTGDLLFVSGHGPVRDDGTLITGIVGSELTREDGYVAARQVGLTMLATLRAQMGNLASIVRLVKVLGMVNSAPDFKDHPFVINGFSDLMSEIWGTDNGIGARSAVGMVLPGHIAVEVEAIFEVNI